MKESVVEKLLQPPSSSSKPKGALIQDLDGSPIESLDLPKPPTPLPAAPARQINDDEPSMLELMMAAQREAAVEVKKKKETETKAKEPSFGSGLKKGFFGNAKPIVKTTSDKTKTNESATATVSSKKTDFDDDIIDLTNVSGKKSVGNIKKDNEKYVFDDVQKALDEEQHPLLQQIKKNEWVTPDLMTIMQSNKVIAKGMKDPKCISAMQLMQSDPNQAMTRFKDDAEVSLFLREFGSVMAAHFEGLAAAQGAAQQQQQQQTNPGISEVNSGGSKIQEIGVLQAQALQRQKEAAAAATASATAQKESAKKSSDTTTESVVKSTAKKNAPPPSPQETEEEKVQRILKDDELRALLMDTEFQKLLVECNDPVKFQQHMRNPETARKIKKLHESGLVQTAK